MDITFLVLSWLIIFSGYFLIGLSIGLVIAYVWITWRENKANKKFTEEIYKYRK